MPRARGQKGGSDLRKLPRIIFTKLGKLNADGLAYHPQFAETVPVREPYIELDERLTGRPLIETMIHEGMHIAVPGMDENTVTYTARLIGRILWKAGYRVDEEELKEKYGERPSPMCLPD